MQLQESAPENSKVPAEVPKWMFREALYENT